MNWQGTVNQISFWLSEGCHKASPARDLLPRGKGFGEPGKAAELALGHRHEHGFAWRPMPLQVGAGIVPLLCSGQGLA
jgi:hypothetical protein